MRKLAIFVLAWSMAGGSAWAALDCARVHKLHAAGKRPADIARELDLTTPEVQECIAGDEPETPAPPNVDANRLPLAPEEVPANANPVPRGPNQQ